MNWFKRQKKQRSEVVTDKLAGKIAGWILKMQNIFSIQLAKYFNRLSVVKAKIVLVTMAISAFSFSIYLIGEGLFKENLKRDITGIRQINLPVLQEKSTRDSGVLSELSLKELEVYEQQLDSFLKNTNPADTGAIHRLKSLADSNRLLMAIYLSKLK